MVGRSVTRQRYSINRDRQGSGNDSRIDRWEVGRLAGEWWEESEGTGGEKKVKGSFKWMSQSFTIEISYLPAIVYGGNSPSTLQPSLPSFFSTA